MLLLSNVYFIFPTVFYILITKFIVSKYAPNKIKCLILVHKVMALLNNKMIISLG